MSDSAATARPLPRGRHGLPRETIVRSQRDRILSALAETMVETGYVGTSVTAIIKRAGVSRETFYEQFRSKEDCFEAAYEHAVQLLLAHILESSEAAALPELTGEQRVDRMITAYLEGLADEPAYARLYLVEVYAVGPKAIARRAELQESFVAMVADILGAHTPEQRFACHTLVAALSSMVTARVAADDLAGLLALREPLLQFIQRSGDLYGSPLVAESRAR